MCVFYHNLKHALKGHMYKMYNRGRVVRTKDTVAMAEHHSWLMGNVTGPKCKLISNSTVNYAPVSLAV